MKVLALSKVINEETILSADYGKKTNKKCTSEILSEAYLRECQLGILTEKPAELDLHPVPVIEVLQKIPVGARTFRLQTYFMGVKAGSRRGADEILASAARHEAIHSGRAVSERSSVQRGLETNLERPIKPKELSTM